MQEQVININRIVQQIMIMLFTEIGKVSHQDEETTPWNMPYTKTPLGFTHNRPYPTRRTVRGFRFKPKKHQKEETKVLVGQ
jgi:hypothetical protein